MKAYYAHSMALYGSAQEERDVNAIKDLGFEVVNPGETSMQLEFEEWYHPRKEHDPLEFFTERVRECDLLVFRAHPDGKIPAGVAKEIDTATTVGMPVIELPSSVLSRTLTVSETREWLQQVGYR